MKVDIGYSNLEFRVRNDYFKLNREKILVPVTLQLQNKDMTFKQQEICIPLESASMAP